MPTNPKDAVQARARLVWNKTRRGTLAMATGTGKSKIAVDRVRELLKENLHARVLLVVPTTRLRDNNWKEEFAKWGASSEWDKITRSCYVSINRFDMTHWDLVVMDEAHNITPNNAEFFDNNHVKEVLGLTATPPRDEEKLEILESIAPVVYVYTMDEAVKERLVAEYEITLYSVPLDNHVKYIPGGTKDKPFHSTEAVNYQYLNKQITKSLFSKNDSMKKFARINRANFMKGLKSKTDAAQAILATTPVEERMLVFCGLISQAELLLPGQTYHSKSDSKALEAFTEGEISKLACVAAMNEGINIPNLDSALIVHFNSNPKDMIQRLGRIIRLREDHIAKISILVAQGTIEEEWIEKALATFDNSKVTYNDIRNVTKSLL